MSTAKTSESVIPKRRSSDWKNKAAASMTPEQLGILLNDIAGMAKHINRLTSLLMVNLGHGQEDEETYLTAIEAMAQRIGWAADMASDRIEGAGSAVYGDAEKWMMPPLFHYYHAAAEGAAA
ncbi:hypothetical protein [Malikia granosa]|uniref:Uncharacterized protein n=1 Tax=Malikia granosa TaxID=263067 RepID=A0A2S9K6V9_9BURK|nr:hypothetical protein [Malikia granosa]PRD66115.1 hypothetical protein C6P64_05975 [Malikia granosa]